MEKFLLVVGVVTDHRVFDLSSRGVIASRARVARLGGPPVLRCDAFLP